MRICSDAHITENTVFLMMYLMRLLESHPYIYGGELVKSIKSSTDSSSVSLSVYHEFFSRTVRVE